MEKRQSTIRAAIERGQKKGSALGRMIGGAFVFISRALGVIVGLVLLVSLGGAIPVLVYLTFKHL